MNRLMVSRPGSGHKDGMLRGRHVKETVVMLLVCLLLLPQLVWAQTPPFQPRIGPNLVTNPNFSGGTSGWSITPSAMAYDSTVSRTADGTGSIRDFALGAGLYFENTNFINVTVGKTYTFSAYIMTTQWPPPATTLYTAFRPCDGSPATGAAETPHASNSRPGVWEEISLTLTPTQTGCIKIAIGRVHTEPSNGAGTLWIDEIYVGEGAGFGSPPSARTPFLGLNLEVDVLGNVKVRRDGVWEDFFPFCVYGDPNRPNYLQYYSNQGFNCDARSGGNTALVAAKNATSTYNPKGMMIVADVGNHLYPCTDGCWGWDAAHANLLNWINEHKSSTAADRQLWWYDDNEVDFGPWQQKMDSMLFLQDNDRTTPTTGTRLHPMFMLQGNWNMARTYRTNPGGVNAPDITGTYADGINSGGAGGAGGFAILEAMQNMVLPAVIVNANIVFPSAAPGLLRAFVYKFLGQGMRAYTMWKDCYPPTDCKGASDRLENVPWLPDVGNIRTELNALLPLLKQPHWTTWTVSHNGGTGMQVGTRDYQGPGDGTPRGHLIVSNETASSKTVTFTIGSLPYSMTSVKNYFDGGVLATPSGASFTLTIPANGINSGTRVVKLEGVGGGDALPTVTISTAPGTTVNTSIALAGSATDDVGVTGLTLACSPSCGSPTVSCPSCGATATSVTWTATVPLQMGANVITVTATDTAAHTANAQVTQTRIIACQEYVHWTFNAGSGSTAADTGTASAPGTLFGSPTWLTGAAARVGAGALHFDGATQYVRNATLAWPAGQPATVELWVKIPGGTPGGTFDIGGTVNLVDNRLGCHITWTDNVVYCDFGADVSIGRVQAPFGAYLNTWTHIAFTADTNRRALYFNGVKVAETLALAPGLPALTGFEAGRYDIQPLETYYHTGDIDDVRLFTCVRSDAEILADYTSTNAAPPVLTVTTSSGSTTLTPVQVQGTATDDVGVMSVGIACSPSCGTPVVTCTPACGASAASVTWTAQVPLALGANVITVTATDAVPQSVTQQITLTRLAPAVFNQSVPYGALH
jgi:hypothetical protein